MSNKTDFIAAINEGYISKGEKIILGAAMLDGEAVSEVQVGIPLKTMNRHGLIAGATGTGKTKTIQVLSEQLAKNGVPVLIDRKSTRLNSSHITPSRMPSSA